MKIINHLRSANTAALLWLCLLGGLGAGLDVCAQQSGATSSSSVAAAASTSEGSTASSAASSAAADVESDSSDMWEHRNWDRRNRHRNERMSIGHNVTLGAGEQAESVVAIFGSAASDGVVLRDVVSIFGNSRVTGPVGHDVVSVVGNVYINSNVGHDVVAVMGNVELGPQAVVDGELFSVGGNVLRDPASVVYGGTQDVSLGSKFGFEWLRPWIENCLLYARPLAIAPGLGWAWTLATLSLLFYVLTALLAPRAVDRCVTTLEESPGYSLLAALLAMLATPILFILLVITLVGIVAIPFLGIALLSLGFFGKLVMLAWLGRRVTSVVSSSVLAHAVFATLIGGVLVTALYLVPVVGFLVYKLLSFVGFGVVVYTLALHFKSKRQPSGQGTADGVGGETRGAPQASFANGSGATASDAAATFASSASRGETSGEPPGASDAVSLPRASFGLRMAALLLDLVLVGFFLNLVFDTHNVFLLAIATYGALMWKLKATTIGGIVFHLRIVRLDGRELDWPTVIVRALSCFLSLIVAGLGFIWIAFDDEKQAWHDKIAGTVVVRVPRGMPLV